MPEGWPKHVEDVSDERYLGNPVFVYLAPGYSFEPYWGSFGGGEHVRAFDTLTEARYRSARKRLYECTCEECLQLTSTSRRVV